MATDSLSPTTLVLVHQHTGEERTVWVDYATKNWKLLVTWLSDGRGISKGGMALDLKRNQLCVSERGRALPWKTQDLDAAVRFWKAHHG